MLRVILVDDESLARQGMRQLLAGHASVAVVGEAASPDAAAELIRSEKPDAIFLDVEMPRADGFDLLAALEAPPKVVFVTAHSEHALRAFEFEAVDYLLKPVHPERLADAVRRLEAALAAGSSSVPYQAQDRICLRLPHRTVVVALSRVAALLADGDFTRVFVEGESPLLICHLLGRYEKELPSPPFVRLDRSIIINQDRIARVEGSGRSGVDLWIEGVPEPFSLGRTARERLKDHLPEGRTAAARP